MFPPWLLLLVFREAEAEKDKVCSGNEFNQLAFADNKHFNALHLKKNNSNHYNASAGHPQQRKNEAFFGKLLTESRSPSC